MLKRVQLFNFDFVSEASLTPVLQDIVDNNNYEKDGKLPFLLTPNVDEVVKLERPESKPIKDVFVQSAYILPDGQPIIIASKLLKTPLQTRLAGSDLFPMLWKECKAKGIKILALTSSDTISAALKKENPDAVCYTLPFFDKDDKKALQKIVDDCVKLITENAIQITVIGVSSPKQHYIAIDTYRALKQQKAAHIPLFCMLGASFEFYLNIKRRAPMIFQKTGMEWLFRFASEPKRLFRRYFIDSAAFIPILVNERKKK